MPVFSPKFLRDTTRIKAGEADSRNVSDKSLNTFFILGIQDWFRAVLPYGGTWFVPYSSNVPSPPDFGPGYTPGAYIWPGDEHPDGPCYKTDEVAYRDTAETQRFIPIFKIDGSNWIFAPEESQIGTTAQTRAYGMKRGNFLFVKGIPSIATNPPLIRIFGKRGPKLPPVQSDGSFLPADEALEIDMPAQYRSHLFDFIQAQIRGMKGDFGGYGALMGLWQGNISLARRDYPQDGMANSLRTMKMSGDYGSAGVDAVTRSGFGW